MPIPFIMLGAAAMAGAAGVTKGASAISSNSKADHMVKAAQDACQQAQEALEEQRAETTNKLETLGTIKLDIWSKEMHDFVQSFQSFKNVRMEGGPELNDRLRLQIENPDNLKNMEIASIKASEITHAGISALGSGALAGIASYGGAMMFASPSTGTAIASLSGVAATNATLAWFGGGSLAAGGLGVAGGTVVLGGIVAGPVLAVAGTLMKAKAEEKLANARQIKAELEQTVEQLGVMTDFMKRVSALSVQYTDFLVDFRRAFYQTLNEMRNIERTGRQKQRWMSRNLQKTGTEKIDFNALSDAEQKKLHQAWLMAQVLYSVLTATLLTEGGEIDPGAATALQDAKTACPMENVWGL